jgi:tRNA wybutosine-synthesizing protein 3
LEILVGDNGWVDHRENGILYSFNATKCMFSWGNLSEKLRMARLDCKDEVIVDLFAGIGYFVLPFLVRCVVIISRFTKAVVYLSKFI